MGELTADALRVLKDIHERGLQVLWSYRVPHPNYNDEIPMPAKDWRVVETQLSRVVEKSEYVVTHQWRIISRRLICDGVVRDERIRVRPGEGEKVVSSQTLLKLSDSTVADTILSESVEECDDGQWITLSVWESEYLEMEHVDQDSDTEYYVGILNRYTLTPLALGLIGRGQTV